MEVKAGLRVGPYELVSPLGAGGMGEVWKARDTRLERTVAIKFSHEGFSERFQREARAIAALNHPNIATLHDVGDNYLVMEFVDGEPVRAPGDVRKLVDIAVQIADGLAAAHAEGIVHRDLKPDNILLAKSGRVKILDFGLAKRSAAPGPDEATIKATQRGTVMGTVAYMSPEQARGEELGVHSDQFSFGQVLYELAAGKRAFERPSAAETMAAIIRDDAEPLPATLPAPLRWVIERLLAKDPADRYDTTRGLYLELASLRGRMSEVTQAQQVVPGAPVRGRSWVAVVLAAGAAVAGYALHAAFGVPAQPDYRFTPVAITNANETDPVWSPDGRSIAYLLREGTASHLMVKSVSGGVPVALVRRRNLLSVTWSRDGERLYYQDRTEPPGFIAWVSRAGGDPVRLSDEFHSVKPGIPAMSPDGNTLAVFMQEKDGAGRAVRRVALSSPPGAKPKPIGNALECCLTPPGLAWSADGGFLLAQNPVDSRNVSLHRYWPDGRSQDMARTSPRVTPLGGAYAVSTQMQQGLQYVHVETGAVLPLLPSSHVLTDPAVSRDGSRLAYVTQTHGLSLREIPLDGTPGRPLAAAKVDQHSVAWAPAGELFAFARQGDIVLRNREGTNERVLVTTKDIPSAPGNDFSFSWLAFSPGGERLLFTCIGCEAGLSLWTVPVMGGAPARVARGDTQGGYAATFSPDGQWIAYLHTRSALPTVLAKLRVGRDDPPVILDKACGGPPAWSPGGEWIACPGADAMELIRPDGGPGRRLSGGHGSMAWARDGKSIYAVRTVEGQSGLYQIDIASGEAKKIGSLGEYAAASSLGGARFSLAPDGKSVATSILEQDGDIWILDGFEPPRGYWGRLWPWK